MEEFESNGVEFFHVGTKQAALDRAYCVVNTENADTIYLYKVTLSKSAVFDKHVRDDDSHPDNSNYIYTNRYEDIGEPSLHLRVDDVDRVTLSEEFSANQILSMDGIYSFARNTLQPLVLAF